MNENVGIDSVVDDLEVEPVAIRDRLPVGDARAPQEDRRRAGFPNPRSPPRRPPPTARPRRRSGSRGGARGRSPLRAASARTPLNPARSRSFAASWIWRVTSVSAGPPCGGLYLNPPSSGGLWDGVITTPSARGPPRALWVRIACETAGVGVYPSSESTATSTPWATSTSTAVRNAGSESACVSRPRNSGPSVPCALR